MSTPSLRGGPLIHIGLLYWTFIEAVSSNCCNQTDYESVMAIKQYYAPTEGCAQLIYMWLCIEHFLLGIVATSLAISAAQHCVYICMCVRVNRCYNGTANIAATLSGPFKKCCRRRTQKVTPFRYTR